MYSLFLDSCLYYSIDYNQFRRIYEKEVFKKIYTLLLNVANRQAKGSVVILVFLFCFTYLAGWMQTCKTKLFSNGNFTWPQSLWIFQLDPMIEWLFEL